MSIGIERMRARAVINAVLVQAALCEICVT
jgi:hypothetical protein